MDDLLQAVKDHALRNYNSGGWDYVVECYSDSEIREAIGRAKTHRGAISNVAKAFGLAIRAEVRADIQNA